MLDRQEDWCDEREELSIDVAIVVFVVVVIESTIMTVSMSLNTIVATGRGPCLSSSCYSTLSWRPRPRLCLLRFSSSLKEKAGLSSLL